MFPYTCARSFGWLFAITDIDRDYGNDIENMITESENEQRTAAVTCINKIYKGRRFVLYFIPGINTTKPHVRLMNATMNTKQSGIRSGLITLNTQHKKLCDENIMKTGFHGGG